MLTELQRELVICVMKKCFCSEKNFSVISLSGPAGTGKTFILKFLAIFKKRIDIEYLSVSNFLGHDVKKKYSVAAGSVCNFVMKSFKMKFHDFVKFHDAIDHTDHVHILNMKLDDLIRKKSKRVLMYRDYVKSRCRYGFKTFVASIMGNKPTIIFLDEFSQLSVSMIMLIVNICNSLSKILYRKIILIISGDINQIKPSFATITNDYTMIKQISSDFFNFEKQKRIKDANYEKFLLSLLKPGTDIRVQIGQQFEKKNRQTGHDILVSHRLD